MVPPSIYKVQTDTAGDLYVMPKPSGERLRDDIQAFSDMGVTRIVSLLEYREAQQLGLAKESETCGEFEIEFVQYPIEDRGLPEKPSFAALVESTCAALRAGGNIAVHCRAGIGRTGMVASCILTRFAVDAEEAISIVSGARLLEIPDTDEQRRFILNFAANSERYA
ncbi:MAG: protein tyrosine phosphatase [Alphaproteobacteria bacterium]|nr:protein tyrosine phosphatase [Alphaproteobacteria bacterium]